jgi:hypothetical protein
MCSDFACSAASVAVELGAYELASSWIERLEEHSDPKDLLSTHRLFSTRCLLEVQRHNWNAAIQMGTEALGTRTLVPTRVRGVVGTYLARAFLGAGDLVRARQMIDDALAHTEYSNSLSVTKAVAARVALAESNIHRALELSHEARAHITQSSTPLEEMEASVRLVLVETLLAAGKLAAARADAQAAAERLLARAEGVEDLELRNAFLTCVPDHVQTLALARELNET